MVGEAERERSSVLERKVLDPDSPPVTSNTWEHGGTQSLVNTTAVIKVKAMKVKLHMTAVWWKTDQYKYTRYNVQPASQAEAFGGPLAVHKLCQLLLNTLLGLREEEGGEKSEDPKQSSRKSRFD